MTAEKEIELLKDGFFVLVKMVGALADLVPDDKLDDYILAGHALLPIMRQFRDDEAEQKGVQREA